MKNAIFHGIQPKKGIGKININIANVDGKLVYIVEDNSVGMDTELVERINSQNGTEEDYNKIGIFNVNKRIKLLFGKDFGVSLESEEAKGTRVTVLLPLQK
jgi:two-component system, sensor histidine kinase YesM